MGTDRSGTYLRGILVPDPRINADSITPKDHATAPSTFTEAGPFPGPASADQDTAMVLRTSGDQSADGHLEILTHRSGGARHDGAGFIWRDVAAGDTTSEYSGWDAPSLVTGWESLVYTTAAVGSNNRPHVIRLQSGKLLCTYSVSLVGVVLIKRYDPSTSAWSSVNLTPTGAASGYVSATASLCQLSSGRVLCFTLSSDQQQVDAYYSDDDGDTWSPGGYRVLDIGTEEATVSDMRAEYSPASGEILLLMLYTDGGTSTAAQYASADQGAQFTQIVEDWENTTSRAITALDLQALPGGGFLMLSVNDTDNNLEQRLFGSAFSVGTSITATEPDSGITTGDAVTVWADDDDTLWFVVNDFSAVDDGRLGMIYRSLDRGATWDVGHDGQGILDVSDSTATTYRPIEYSAMSIGGRTAFVHRWDSNGVESYDPMSVGVAWLGGMSNHTGPSAVVQGIGATANEDFKDVDYCSFSRQSSTSTKVGGIWLPWVSPGAAAMNWTLTGGGGASSAALVSPGALEITSTAADALTYYRTNADIDLFADIELEIDAGDGSTAAGEIVAMMAAFPGGGLSVSIEIHFSSSGYRVYDQHAGAYVGAAVAFDLTTFGHLRVALSYVLGGGGSGVVKIWHARSAHIRDWTLAVDETLTSGGAGTTFRFGNLATVANVSRWRQIGYCAWPHHWAGTQIDELAASWSNPADLHPRAFPTLPSLLTDGVQIQAVSGPTWVGETWQIETAYEHPVKACLPQTSPSPSQGWRSTTDNASYSLAFDLERQAGFADSFWESSSLGVFLVESNLQECKLQGWDGAAWQDLVSLDASDGFGSRAYRRKGRIVYPDTGTAPSAERWSPHQMHAGDSMALEDGEDTVYRRIASNSEGGWRSGTKLARLMLNAEDLDGGEDATGTGTIYRRNFGGVVHDLSVYYRYVRLHIPAQETWSGDYRIGQLIIGPVFVFGLQYGNGWAYETASNTDLQTRTSGSRSARVLGPRRRAVEVSWADQPQDTTRMWDSEPSPDYVTGVNSGDPVASIADTAYQVLGLTERTDGPASPVVYLGKIDRGSGSHLYTMDPEWLYGRITTEVASVDHVVGEEGVSVVLRANRIRIEEEV